MSANDFVSRTKKMKKAMLRTVVLLLCGPAPSWALWNTARSESACGCHSHPKPGQRVYCSSKRYSPTPYRKLCNSTLTLAANQSDLTPLCSDETDYRAFLLIPIGLVGLWRHFCCHRRRAEQATYTVIPAIPEIMY